MVATHEDAMLAVQLMRWGAEMGLEDALHTVFTEEFDPDAVTDDPSVRKVLTFGEVIGTLVKHDLLDRDFLIDLLWVEGMWSRVGPTARRARERASEPRLYENFEALVSSPAA